MSCRSGPVKRILEDYFESVAQAELCDSMKGRYGLVLPFSLLLKCAILVERRWRCDAREVCGWQAGRLILQLSIVADIDIEHED